MSGLFQLAYISRSTLKGSKEEIQAQIEDILKSSQKNNQHEDITGALLYSGGYFCQILEGPAPKLTKLFETIQADSRHEGVIQLHFHVANNRLFSDWAMAYAGIDDKLHFNIEDIKESMNELSLHDKGKYLVKILDELVRKHQTKHHE